ncbi:MAG: DNA repair exonuclease [Clostridia bacterium]|nr:DNA repair exonuclease [Clostridia bacterium]
MSEIKFLHTGDLHIGASRTGVKGGRTEIINTFFRIINLCKTENVDFLLISGDLFDRPFVDADTASEIIGAMSQIPDTVIAISPGNHDCACPESIYRTAKFPQNVVIFSSFSHSFDFPHKNVCLFGAAFTDSFQQTPLLNGQIKLSPDRINICVLHGDLVSTATESSYNPITTNAICECGFDYLALGHIHKRTEIKKLGKTYFSYCGCPDGRGFDEDGSHGVYLGTISKGNCKLEYTEMSSRQYILDHTDITGCKTSLDITSKILAQLKENYSPDYGKNLYRISLTGSTNVVFLPNITQIEAALSDEVEYIRISDNTVTDLSDINLIAAENSLRGIFVQKMLQMTEDADEAQKELHTLALQLGLKAFEKGVSLNDN